MVKIKVKGKDKENWSIWHYGTMISPTEIDADGVAVPVVARTVCESTGLFCKGREVYENDWISVYGNGETHKFLVGWGRTDYRAYEDDEVSYNLKNVLDDKTCKIIGNLYD